MQSHARSSLRLFSFEFFTPALAWGGLIAFGWLVYSIVQYGVFYYRDGFFIWLFTTVFVAGGKFLLAFGRNRVKL